MPTKWSPKPRKITSFCPKSVPKCPKNPEKERCGTIGIDTDEKPFQVTFEPQKGLIDLELTRFFRLIARARGVKSGPLGQHWGYKKEVFQWVGIYLDAERGTL
jgi:hypothetical protein